MQYTKLAIFALFAGALAEPARPRPRPSNPSPNPSPNPAPNPSPSPAGASPGSGKRLKKGNTAACIASIGSAGGNCGVDIAAAIEAGANEGYEIAGCVFDLMGSVPDCQGLRA